jgi:hypothetical protein
LCSPQIEIGERSPNLNSAHVRVEARHLTSWAKLTSVLKPCKTSSSAKTPSILISFAFRYWELNKHKLKAIENSNYYELNPNWGWVWRANRLPEKMKCKQAISANLNWVLNCEINSAENLYLQRIMIKHGQYRIN